MMDCDDWSRIRGELGELEKLQKFEYLVPTCNPQSM